MTPQRKNELLIKSLKTTLKDHTFRNFCRGKLLRQYSLGVGLRKFESGMLDAFDALFKDEPFESKYLDKLDQYITMIRETNRDI